MKPGWYRAWAVEESPKQAGRHGFQAASQEAQSHEEWKVGSPLPLWASVNPSLCSPPVTEAGLAKVCRRHGPCLPFLYRIRMSGIKGLQGVVRKTVNDELQANIWDPQHMDKIVPSLLFNLQHVEEAER